MKQERELPASSDLAAPAVVNPNKYLQFEYRATQPQE